MASEPHAAPPPDAGRLFTPEELRRLVTHAGDLAADAIAAGDVEGARTLCREMKDAHQPLYSNYIIWALHTLTYIAGKYGLETLHAALPGSIAPWLRPVAELFRNGVTREAVSGIAQVWRMYCTDFGPVTEDDDCIVMALAGYGPCFRASQEDRLPFGGSDADVQPADYPDITLVAMHCTGASDPKIPLMAAAILHGEALMTEWLGYPPFVVDFHAGGTPRRLLIFKDPSSIPPRYFERIGKQRDTRRIRGAVDVAGGRIFAPDDLDHLSTPFSEQALMALDLGQLAMARGFCRLSKGEWYPAHHILRDWITGLLSFVYRSFGADAVYDCVWGTYNEQSMVPMLDAVQTLDLRAQVEALAGGFRQHAMRFRIEEDDEKFVFVTEPCGSGGRLLDEGAYSFPKNFARIRERHKAGFFLEDFPVYCVHCPATNDLVMERGGPYYLMVDGDLMTIPDGNCNFYIFKQPDAVPERFYQRAGRRKESCKQGCAR